MKLMCTTGYIGIGGVRYATGDVFEVEDDAIVKALIDGGDAEEFVEIPDVVEEVVETPPPEPEVVVEDEPEKPVRGRRKK